MKTTTRTLVLLFLTACGSAGQNNANLLKPEIQIRQLAGSQYFMEYRGTISVAYSMLVKNRSAEAIVLRRLDLQTLGGGPYELRNTPIMFKKSIQPDETVVVEFSNWGFSYGGRGAASEPVALRGIAYFDSEAGAFQTVFSQLVRQPQTGVE